MTCTPIVTILKNSTNTTTGGIFQSSRATVTLLVNYCGACEVGSSPPDVPYQVLEDINGTSWDIVVGRPLAEIDGAGVRSAWLTAVSADMTLAEVTAVNAGTKEYAYYYVTDYRCQKVEAGDPNLWSIIINVSMMTVENSHRYPHCSVDIQTQSRMASAWRMGPGPATKPFKIPTTNISGTGPSMPGATSGTDLPHGRFDPKFWRGQVSAYMDVEGSDIDINGNPMAVAIEQIKHSVSFVARKPYLGYIPPTGFAAFEKNTGWTDWVQGASCYLNKRNNAEMWGYGVGELLCDSVTVSDIDEQFSRVTLTFTWDEWGHFDQQIWSEGGKLGGLSNQTYEYVGTKDRLILTAFAVFWTTSYHEAFNVAELNAQMPMAVWSVAVAAFNKPTCYYPAGD
jgi:hypothetical protein|tara:strand:- start:841 stop:2028 length:1188 start_codon:yes stop_codon:yes gene_type:complete